MFYKLIIKDVVYKDIEDFVDYAFRTTFSQNASEKIINMLLGAIKSLDFLPSRFESYNHVYHRMIVNKSYKIIYKIDETNKQVIIMRILRTQASIEL